MRFKLIARPVKTPSYIPVHYNSHVQGFVYKLLSEELPEVHDRGYSYENLKFRHFTFSRLFSKGMKKYGDFFKIVNPLSLFLSFLLDPMPKAALNEIIMGKKLLIGKEEFELLKIKTFESQLPSDKSRIQMDFQTLSPIVTCRTFRKEKNRKWTQYYTPFDPEFVELIKGNLVRKLKSVVSTEKKEEDFNIHIAPIDVDPDKTEAIVKYKGTVIKGYTGKFRYKGDSRLAELGYQTGMGSKNPQGFGMIMVKNIKKLGQTTE